MVAEIEVRSSGHVLAGTRADFEVYLYRDGTLTSPTDPTAVAVSVVDEDGNAIASGVGANGGTGIVTFTGTAAQLANVGRVSVTWSNIVINGEPAVSVVTEHELVGAHLFTEYEARNVPGLAATGVNPLANATTYPDLEIRLARDRIQERFDDILGWKLGRRFVRETLRGTGRDRLMLSHWWVRSIRAVSYRSGSSWVAFTEDQLADCLPEGNASRMVEGNWGAGTLYRVSYECGRDIPPALRQAGLIVARFEVVPNNIPTRATSLVADNGQSFRLATAGMGNQHYGIPDVDAVLNEYRMVGV